MAGLVNVSGSTEENRGPTVNRTIIPLAILATLAVIARFYTRHMKGKRFAEDDYTILCAMILNWGTYAVVVCMAHFGMGRHISAVHPTDLENMLKALFALTYVYGTTVAMIKISVLFLYRSLFPVRSITIVINIAGALILAWWVFIVLFGTFLCRPIRAQWDKTIPASCINDRTTFIAVGVPNSVLDLAVLSIPVAKIWNLQMSRTQKTLISGTFMIGIFVCAAGIVRLIYLFEIGQDITWDITGAAIWGSVEPSVGVTCACVPILRPLLDLVVLDPVRRTLKSVRVGKKRSISGGNASGPARKDTSAKNFRRLNEPVMDWPDTGLYNTTAVGESLHYDEDAFTMDTIEVRHDVDISRVYPK